MEITKDQIEKIEKFVESKLDSMNWFHTQEVRKIALRLARLEKADKDIVEATVLFHDVGKIKKEGLGHAEVSAEIARNYLEKENFDQRFIEEVVYCVIAHELPWKNQANLVNTTEAKVVFDADMIQQLSEFSILKHAIIYQNSFKEDYYKGVEDFRENIFKAYNMLFTDNGRKLAEDGYKFVKEFCKNLL